RMMINTKRAFALTGIGVLALAACGGPQSGTTGSGGASDAGGGASASAERTEVGALTPRIVLAHDGGVTTLDSADGSELASAELEGYVRLNPSGDGRHVAVRAEDSFTFYDTGLEAQAHGDHVHYYEQPPGLTDLALEAPQPGHVVPHGERTALFADGTGAITTIDPGALRSEERRVGKEGRAQQATDQQKSKQQK